jgi:plasmid rolling circle replication initiator protein Rep
MDKSNDESVQPFANIEQPFLTDLIPDDEIKQKGKKQKRQNWDTRKQYTTQVADILASGDLDHRNQAKRVKSCADFLQFGWVHKDETEVLEFKSAYFCRVRNCPICQWRRAQMWVARFIDALPRIYAAHPTMRYVLLTLTIQNCPISELRPTVQLMNKAWDRLTKRKSFPALGFVRSLEITKEADTYDKKTKKLIHKARSDYAHPHFHIILALPPSYFGGNYLSTADWAQLWKEALRIDYTPVCDVRIVKIKNTENGAKNESEAILAALRAAIVETIKYTVKPSDMVQDAKWFLGLVDQLRNVRAVALGGIFKQFLKEADDADAGDAGEEEENAEPENAGGLFFGWKKPVKRYQKVSLGNINSFNRS